MTPRFRHLDLFAGIGGFSRAVEWLGGTTVAFVEWESWNRRVLAKHWPEAQFFGDIHDVGLPEIAEAVYHQLTDEQWQEFDMAARRKNYDGAVEMYRLGASVQDCADYYGVTRQAMYMILKRRGVKFRPHLRYGEENHFYRGGMTSDDYAHNFVEKAILRGDITPTPCEVCGDDPTGSDGRRLVHAHHDDYNYPARVRFLCQRCHHEWHKHNRAVELGKEGMPTVLAGTIDLVTGGY